MDMDQADDCDEIRVVFDRYNEKSLKVQSHIDRADGTEIHYPVTSETQIGHHTTKYLLSSIETKDEFTVFLSQELADVLVLKYINYIVVYRNTCISNIENLDPALKMYNHDEILRVL